MLAAALKPAVEAHLQKLEAKLSKKPTEEYVRDNHPKPRYVTHKIVQVHRFCYIDIKP